MNVFIDGRSGTTGLRIYERLEHRPDVEILRLPEEARRDPERRARALNSCDIAFLCLPDKAAIEAADMVESDHVVILDTSTAHRTDPAWAYGFPELSPDFRTAVAGSKRIAVPGCHASGFIALVYPLIEAGVLPASALLTCFSLTGYSGGGKTTIAEYEAADRDPALDAPRQYGLTQSHKHLPEMQKITGLAAAPLFSPVISDFYSGLVVTVPLFRQQLVPGADSRTVRDIYQNKYHGPIVNYIPQAEDGGFLSSNRLAYNDSMEILVAGNDERILLIARYDNLGKGASGAALQCMNIVSGIDDAFGLDL